MNLDLDLREILTHYPSGLGPRGTPRFLGNAGGLSGSLFWRYESGIGSTVAKAWPVEFRDRGRLERIDRWIARAADLRFVSTPIACLSGESFVERAGRFWQIGPWLPGAPDLDEPPSPEHVEAAFQGLAIFHRRAAVGPEARFGRSAGLERRLQELNDLLEGGFDRLADRIARSPASQLREDARRWIELGRRLSPRLVGSVTRASGMLTRVQPCLRDARRDHFLFERSELTGLVDFGAMDVDCVATDLARLIGDWLIADRDGSLIRRALAAYQAIRPLDATETELIPIFEQTTAVLAPGRWIRWHFVEGREFDDPAAVGQGLARSLRRLEWTFARATFADSPGG